MKTNEYENWWNIIEFQESDVLPRKTLSQKRDVTRFCKINDLEILTWPVFYNIMLYPSVKINDIHASFQKLLIGNQKWDGITDTDEDADIDMIPMRRRHNEKNRRIYCKSRNFREEH